MAFWGVIAENMLDCEPYLPRAEKDASLQMVKEVQLVVRVGLLGENLPDIAGLCQCLLWVPGQGFAVWTYLIAAKSACTGFSMAAWPRSSSAFVILDSTRSRISERRAICKSWLPSHVQKRA